MMNNKINVSFIVFDDDNNQKKIIDTNIISNLKEYDVTFWLINPKDFVDLENNSFNSEDFKNHVFELTKGHSIKVVASDCNLIKIDDFKVQGIDLVSILLSETRKNFNCPFILYSGQINEASKHILEKINVPITEEMEKEKSDVNSIGILTSLMQARIKFSGRSQNSYCDDIVKIIKSEVDTKDIIISSFNKFGLAVMHTGNSDYDGKPLNEIVQLINQNDTKGQRYIQEFVELAIAHYTSLNA